MQREIDRTQVRLKKTHHPQKSKRYQRLVSNANTNLNLLTQMLVKKKQTTLIHAMEQYLATEFIYVG